MSRSICQTTGTTLGDVITDDVGRRLYQRLAWGFMGNNGHQGSPCPSPLIQGQHWGYFSRNEQSDNERKDSAGSEAGIPSNKRANPTIQTNPLGFSTHAEAAALTQICAHYMPRAFLAPLHPTAVLSLLSSTFLPHGPLLAPTTAAPVLPPLLQEGLPSRWWWRRGGWRRVVPPVVLFLSMPAVSLEPLVICEPPPLPFPVPVFLRSAPVVCPPLLTLQSFRGAAASPLLTAPYRVSLLLFPLVPMVTTPAIALILMGKGTSSIVPII